MARARTGGRAPSRPGGRGPDKVGGVHPDVPPDAHEANGAGSATWLRFLVLGFAEEGKHQGISFDPFLETGGHAERGDAGRDGGVPAGIGGSLWDVLPADKGEEDVFHGVDGTEIVDVRVLECKCGGPEPKDEGSKER